MAMTTHLRLGRVSNLPTVWTNVLAAGALSGAVAPPGIWMSLLLAMSLFYIAGMYLNDAWDTEYDRQYQSYRPIPSGLITRERVECFALVYLSAGFLLVYAARIMSPQARGSGSMGWLISVVALCLFIVVYNRHHKNNPYSPLLMAACRASVLVCAAYALTASLQPVLLLAVFACVCWITGLTYHARHENDAAFLIMCTPVVIGLLVSLSTPASLIPLGALVILLLTMRGDVGLMIAGICLVDGIFIASVWGLPGALLSLVAFFSTSALQRFIAGT